MTGALQIWANGWDSFSHRQYYRQILIKADSDKEKASAGGSYSHASCLQVWGSICSSCWGSDSNFWPSLHEAWSPRNGNNLEDIHMYIL